KAQPNPSRSASGVAQRGNLGALTFGMRLTESVDTTTAGGRLVFHIFGALAEFERAIIRERTRAGLLAARNRGRIGGRCRSLTEKDIRAARAMLTSPEISFGELAKRLRVPKATL